MRLFKMELYKLCHDKLFWWELLCLAGLMALYFWFVEVGDELAVVGETSYSGYSAVQVNRQLAEEWKGILTEEKIDRIIETYGIPSKLEENMPYWRDGNFLNEFVVAYFTDGNWQNGTLPTQRYPLAQSELGQACEAAGMKPVLEYGKGWRAFVEVLQFGLVLGSVLILSSISAVFARESQTKMLPLILTTQEGRRKSISAKICAAFALTAAVFAGIVLLDLALCGLVYGLDGFRNVTGVVLGNKMLRGIYQMEFSRYFVRQLLFGLQGLLLLCAVTLLVSAKSRTSFMAVILSAIFWGAPVLLRLFFNGFGILIYATPLFLVMRLSLDDVAAFWKPVLLISLLAGILCTAKSAANAARRSI